MIRHKDLPFLVLLLAVAGALLTVPSRLAGQAPQVATLTIDRALSLKDAENPRNMGNTWW